VNGKKKEAVFSHLVIEEAMELLSDSLGDDDKLHLYCLTQNKFSAKCYLHVCATCFGVYSFYSQACQYKTLTNLDTVRI